MTATDPSSPTDRPTTPDTRRRYGQSVAERLGDGTFDLLVIGAGINGCGIARDAAMRGLRVLLLDKGDIASGTTAWSSRLIHGGLRYLEYGEVGLVRESLHERETLLRTAAHLVRPLPLMIPIYEDDKRGKGLVRLGMIGYDVLSTGKSLDRHRMLSVESALARAPGLEQRGLTGAALYYDGQVEYAERLAVENAIDAEAHGAVVLTYCRVDEITFQGRRVTGATFTDLLDDTTHTVRAAVTVNVTGPWVDATLGNETAIEPPAADSTAAANDPATIIDDGSTGHVPASSGDGLGGVNSAAGSQPTQTEGTEDNSQPDRESVIDAGQRFLRGFLAQFRSGAPGGKRLIGGTKGSHIIVAPFAGAPQDALYVEARTDGRPFFIIPWNDLFLIGTTDVRYEGDLDRVVASDEEIDYLIEETNRVLPTAALERDDVLYTYSGIRPLPWQGEGAEGSITRRHLVLDHAPDAEGLISIVGGKLTTYRELAEQTVDDVYGKLDRPTATCRTEKESLPGARLEGATIGQDDRDAFTAAFTRSFPELTAATARHLVRTYGTRAANIARLARDEPELGQPIGSGDAIAAEIVFAVREEGAQSLADVLLRRTMLAYQADNAVGADETAARIAGPALGWDAERQQSEVAGYRSSIERYRPAALMATMSAS
ncbi:MAG TPA: glycerol-3-phosphate dehydrogenase/oxidase [Thermomicrobiales bacterium]|jgi:glycerol-3-phosphate dehydrogenase|nr:glycerol-3-phosphate dehydrogenase/oxidase [Thermomicrobiales bacterium]